MTTPTESDFINGPLADHGITVTRVPVTQTQDNITGESKYADGTPEQISCVFENANKKYNLDEAGLTEGADARMFVAGSVVINKYDKIVHAGITYRVDTVSVRRFDSNIMFKTTLLFEIS